MHSWWTSNCHRLGNQSIFTVCAEMTAVKDSKEWCLNLGDLNIFPYPVYCLLIHNAFFIVGVSSNLSEAGTTILFEVSSRMRCRLLIRHLLSSLLVGDREVLKVAKEDTKLLNGDVFFQTGGSFS